MGASASSTMLKRLSSNNPFSSTVGATAGSIERSASLKLIKTFYGEARPALLHSTVIILRKSNCLLAHCKHFQAKTQRAGRLASAQPNCGRRFADDRSATPWIAIGDLRPKILHTFHRTLARQLGDADSPFGAKLTAFTMARRSSIGYFRKSIL